MGKLTTVRQLLDQVSQGPALFEPFCERFHLPRSTVSKRQSEPSTILCNVPKVWTYQACWSGLELLKDNLPIAAQHSVGLDEELARLLLAQHNLPARTQLDNCQYHSGQRSADLAAGVCLAEF